MSLALPAIITNSTGVSAVFERSGAADITDGTPEAMAIALRGVLASGETWRTSSSRARNEIAEHYRADAVARHLEELYATVMRPE